MLSLFWYGLSLSVVVAIFGSGQNGELHSNGVRIKNGMNPSCICVNISYGKRMEGAKHNEWRNAAFIVSGRKFYFLTLSKYKESFRISKDV